MSEKETEDVSAEWGHHRDGERVEPLALLLAWSRVEPGRTGEVALLEGPRVLGRGPKRSDDEAPRVVLVRQRPGRTDPTAPLESPRVSRKQLVVRPIGDHLDIHNVGRCPLFVNGFPAERAALHPGDTVRLGDELVFLCTRRPLVIPDLRSYPHEIAFGFGKPDPDGLVGESPAAWRLRDELTFVARSGAHALVLGRSGAGKELAARAIHRLSSRGSRPLVSRNAATFPEGIIDAELFGNVKNYPNPGSPERQGLIGQADGNTLFLDEIGEIPAHLQAHLLRVLDARGEYQRLGESKVRTADIRVIAATNRDPSSLKDDFAARLTVRLEVPSLDERRDDLPLLVEHRMRVLVESHEDLRRQEAPRVSAELMERLLSYEYPRQVRDLEQLLWRALAERTGATLTVTSGVRALLAAEQVMSATGEAEPEPPAGSPDLDRAQIEAVLARCDGNVTRAARELGLKNRFALYRLMRKHGVPTGTSSAKRGDA